MGSSFAFAIAVAIVMAACRGDAQRPAAPYITFAGNLLPNNSAVPYRNLLNNNNSTVSVRCNTDLNATCCQNGGPHSGRWVAVGRSQDILRQSFVNGAVELNSVRGSGYGNYRCEIDTVASIARSGPRDILYITVFEASRDSDIILRVEVVQTHPPLFSLTCQVHLWPATTVTWKRDSTAIEGGVTTSVTESSYFNVLNVTEEGVYTCEVFNEATPPNARESGRLYATTPLTPTNLTVTQTGGGNVRVSWSPAGRVKFYIVTYHDLEQTRSGSRSTQDTSLTLHRLYSNVYSLRIAAITDISRSVLGPVNITLDQVFVEVTASVPSSGAYLGQSVRLSCHVTITGPLNLTEPPTITWYTPIPSPNATTFSPEERVFISEFVVDSFNYSHVETYTCLVNVAGLTFSERDYKILRINRNSKLSVEASDVEIHSMEPLHFTLVCYSFGGIPANVTWTKDSTVIGSGVTALREDFTGYKHTLSVTDQGFYTCTVSNASPESASASINATIPNPPSNVTLTQNSVNTVLMSWTRSDGIELYTLVYGRGSRETMRLNGAVDSVTIELNQYPFHDGYMFEITAHTAFPSPTIGPLEFSLGGLVVDVHLIDIYRGERAGNAYIGFPYILTCDVLVYGDLNGTLEFVWTGPGELPPTPIRTNTTHSELRFQPLRLSQDGEYSCTVKLEGFPYPSTRVRDLYSIFTAPMFSVRPTHNGPYYAGTVLNLTCHIRLYPGIDIPVVENIQWVIGGLALSSPLPSTERVTFTNTTIEYFPLDVTDNATVRCDVLFTPYGSYRRSDNFELTVEVLPPLEAELIAPFVVIAGNSATLECSVTEIPSLIAPPQLQLIGPEGMVLASAENFSISITLDSVATSQAGDQYYCQSQLEIEAVGVSMSSSSDNYTVSVRVSPDTVTLHKEPEAHSVIIGSTVTLICQATFDPLVNTDPYFESIDIVQVTWRKPGYLPILEGEVYMDKQSGAGLTYSSNFTTTDIQLQEEGVYVCNMKILGEKNIRGYTTRRRVSINIFDPPSPVVEITAPSVATGGDSVTLGCIVTPVARILQLLSPQSYMELVKEGDVDSIATSPGLNLSHIVSPVLASHGGIYHCRSVLVVEGLPEPLSQSINHSLTVIIPGPTFTLSSCPPENMNISLGSTVAFVCDIKIDSSYDVIESVEVTWSGPRLSSSREGYVATQSGDGGSYVSVLAILEVATEDEGEYTCHLSIVGGNQHIVLSSPTTSTITLGLVPQPTLALSSSPQGEVNQGSSVVLTCNATFNSPLDSIQLTWGRPHTITTNDDGRTTIAETNTGVVYTSHLTVSDIGERDEGEYVCTLTGIDRNGEHVTVHHSITVAVSGSSSSSAVTHCSGLSWILIAILLSWA